MYVAGVKELYSRYPQKFISLIGDPDNETDVYIETAYRAHKLKGLKVLTKNSAGQWLYLETEKTPDEAMTSLYKLLELRTLYFRFSAQRLNQMCRLQ